MKNQDNALFHIKRKDRYGVCILNPIRCNMKIGLIGINMYPRYLNFACALHTHAFQQFLLDNHIESTVIDYVPVDIGDFDLIHPADYYRKLYKKYANRKFPTEAEQKENEKRLDALSRQIREWDAVYEERESRYEKFRKFIDKNYIKTTETYDSDLLEIKDPGFDCYICVTDVIWSLLPVHSFDRAFLLASKAMEGKEKISYAASRGVPRPYSPEEKTLFFKCVNDIDSVSVREKSLKDFIEDNTDKKVDLVLDPVMLHDRSFWHKKTVKPKEENYILLYYVMEKASDTIENAVRYAKEHNMTVVELSDRHIKGGRIKDKDIDHVARYDVGMEEWLGYIEHASCIFTNSFHGCCFSILFEKLFYVGHRNGDKVDNVLGIFGLQNLRIPDTMTSFDQMPRQIDYTAVNAILDREREDSKRFILDAIKDAENRIKNGEKKDTDYENSRRQLKYPIWYRSSSLDAVSNYDPHVPGYKLRLSPRGIFEISNENELYQNDGTAHLEKNKYHREGYEFAGWNIRVKIDLQWFWYTEKGTLASSEDLKPPMPRKGIYNRTVNKLHKLKKSSRIKLFGEEDLIPHIPVNHISQMIAEAVWK